MNVTVTDEQADGRTDGHCMAAKIALALHRAVKIGHYFGKLCSNEKGPVFLTHSVLTITPCSKKVSCLMFNNNFCECGSIFKILSPGDSQENSVCTHHKDFHLTCNMLLHYLVSQKSKKCY